MLEDYTQSILMQLALARKDELFNGSVIASSSFFTLVHSRDVITFIHGLTHGITDTNIMYTYGSAHADTYTFIWSWMVQQFITQSVQFYLIIQTRRVKLPSIRFHQRWHSRRIPKQQTQTHRVWRLMGLTSDVSPWGGQLCLPAFLPSHLAALY